MKVTKEEIMIYMSGYSTHKNYDVEKFLALSDKVRSSKEFKNLNDRVKGSR